MNKIRILSDEVANKIAAGEVIERPASVVKECIENAIDAGATTIIVRIMNGGRELIQISDNGCGMNEEDAFLALERHATSKIRSADDITHINTMGFRGEALPSIASICDFQITTRTAEESTATELSFRYGKLENMQKIAANQGTTIIVKRIFYNVPARRKFLKSEAVEYKHILNYIHYQSVLFPQISFVLYHNQKEKINYPGAETLENRLLAIFGTLFHHQNYLFLQKETELCRIYGYLQDIVPGKVPDLMDVHYLFINRRYINDKTVFSALRAGYEPFLKKYRFFEGGKVPDYILFIEIEPEEIDVNVHPAKTEIRFRNQGAIYQLVKEAVYTTLQHHDQQKYEEVKHRLSVLPLATPLSSKEEIMATELMNQTSVKGILPTQMGINSTTSFVKRKNTDHLGGSKNLEPKPNTPQLLKAWENFLHQPSLSQSTEQTMIVSTDSEGAQIFKTLQEDSVPLWQLHNTYIFIQVDDGLIVLDQHAAHERIIYEKLLQNIHAKKPNKQKLIFPLVIDLPTYLAENIVELLQTNYETLDNIGFTIKSFSGNSLVIDEIPAELECWDGGNIFIDILHQIEAELAEKKDFRLASAASIACKASLKAGKKLSKKEMHELIKELFNCEFPFHCPHGRPLIFKMTLTDFEKMFKRIL